MRFFCSVDFSLKYNFLHGFCDTCDSKKTKLLLYAHAKEAFSPSRISSPSNL